MNEMQTINKKIQIQYVQQKRMVIMNYMEEEKRLHEAHRRSVAEKVIIISNL
jgi:hypothetical protein